MINSNYLFPALARVFTVATLVLICAGSMVPSEARAQSNDTFYYWVTPGVVQSKTESFVIAVDSSKAAAIDAIFAKGGRPGFSGHIAAGIARYNRNYYTPGHRNWNWYVTSVDDVFDSNTTALVDCECPAQTANPSDIAANPDE